MELDYILLYTALVSLLALSLAITEIPTPGHNANYFLASLAVAAKHPGTVIRVILVVPEGTSITLSENRIILENIALPESIVAFYRKTELGESRGLVLQTSFRFENNITLTSGIYLLEIESRPGYIKVSILDYRNLKA